MPADTALWIKNVRRRAGFATQADLADALGVNRSAVGNWESGRGVPSMSHAERFAAVTKRPRAEVLSRFGYPIGGGEPTSATTPPLPPEWLDAIRGQIAAGVAEGRDQGMSGEPLTPAQLHRRRTYWLRAARRRLDMTREEVDKRLGARPGQYGRWEDGVSEPRGAQVDRLAALFRIPEELITRPPLTDQERLETWQVISVTELASQDDDPVEAEAPRERRRRSA